jgi:hypothetical protein
VQSHSAANPTARHPQMDCPAVAIITPYYNTGPIFNDTVHTMRAQSLEQWEWLIVNDGSTDPEALATLEPLRQGEDPRIRVVDQPNRGLPAARNAGVAASSAPLLFFLDSDDLIDPTALEKLAWLLHSYPDCAFATAWSTGFGAQEYCWPRGFEVGERFLFENTTTPMVMIRRAVFEAVGGFDATRIWGLEDYELWLCCAAHDYWGRDIPEFLLHQRRKTAQQYPGYSWPLRDDPRRFRAFQREMRARYPDLYRQGLPHLPAMLEPASIEIPQALPFTNPLPAGKRLLLLAQPNVEDHFILTASEQLARRGYSCTVCMITSTPHLPFAEPPCRADVFVLEHFLRPADHPRFLHYIVQSRHMEVVFVSASTLSHHLIAYLRAHCPELALIDYTYVRGIDDSYAELVDVSATYDDLLDLYLVGSVELLDRLVTQGLPPERCAVLPMAVGDTPFGAANDVPAHSNTNTSQVGEHLDMLIEIARTLSRSSARVSVTAAVGLSAAARAVDELRRHDRELLADAQRSFWRWVPNQLTAAEWRLARKRLLLWGYPLRRFLGSHRLRPLRRAIRKIHSRFKRQVRSGRYDTS